MVHRETGWRSDGDDMQHLTAVILHRCFQQPAMKKAGIPHHRPGMDLAVEPAYELVVQNEMSLLVEIVLVDNGRYRRCIGR